MPVATAVAAAHQTRYRAVFPDWHAPRPVGWYFMEQLLEARAASAFPTNGHRPDEDVNVYLARLLEDFVAGSSRGGVSPDAVQPWQTPTPGTTRRACAAWYRNHADHRLLCLGLFDRGDLRRRRDVPWGRDRLETRQHDLATGQHCYEAAVNLLAGRGGALAGLVPVLRKLAEGFADYVQVLAVLARRRLGLGAVLGEGELAGLLRGPQDSTPAPAGTMDDLLDLMNVWRAAPDPRLGRRLDALARGLGVDPAQLGLASDRDCGPGRAG